MEFPLPKPVDYDDKKPAINDIILCGNCGMPNVLTLTGTREISEEEFAALTPEEKRDLNFAARAAKRAVKTS